MNIRLSLRTMGIVPALALAALASGACSSSPATGTGGGGSGTTSSGTTSTTSPGSTTSSTGSGPSCPPGPGYGGNETSIQVGSATATVVDLNGAPVAGVAVQLCGLDICLTDMTSSQGTVTVSANKMMKKPIFKYGDALTFAKLGVPITMATTTLPTLVTGALPATGAAFKVGGDTVSGGVTISIDAGAAVVVDELNYDTPDKQTFRAVQVPVDKIKPMLDPENLGLEMLFGVSPIETTFCPAAKVTVPNTPAWPAGTAVEFYAYGVETGQEWAPYGGFTKIADGTVSADGATVSTNDGAGFPVLETFGVRKKP
jgi:hypothetical protein